MARRLPELTVAAYLLLAAATWAWGLASEPRDWHPAYFVLLAVWTIAAAGLVRRKRLGLAVLLVRVAVADQSVAFSQFRPEPSKPSVELENRMGAASSAPDPRAADREWKACFHSFRRDCKNGLVLALGRYARHTRTLSGCRALRVLAPA